MNLFKNTLLASALAIGLVGCDIVEGDKVDYSNLPTGSGKKVLLEDFTGHQCGNCPGAHSQAESLKDTYGDDLVIISVHAGGFANVIPQIGYTADYTTPMGDDLLVHYDADNEGLPVGMINRRVWSDNKVLQKFASWGSQIATIISESPQMEIEIDGEVDQASGMVTAEIEMTYYVDAGSNHNLTVVLTEDAIVSKQADYSLGQGYVPDYIHKHMLRANLCNDTWGETVKNGSIFAGEELTKDFSVAIDPDWNLDELSLVAFITDNTTKEIIQVEEYHLD